MERLKHIENTMISCVEKEMTNLAEADIKELGEAIDIIKDIEEAIYYCTITEAMEGKDYSQHWEGEYDHYRDMDKEKGKMYYSGSYMKKPQHDKYEEGYTFPLDMREDREGRAPMTRKSYMEGKESHQPKEKQMKELEKYMMELTTDIVEMIHGSSSEEKQLLQKKLAALAEKVGQTNV
jgi:hypothetical protein